MKFKGGKTTSIQGNVNNHFSWWYKDADGPITALKEGIGKSFNRQNLCKISERIASKGSQRHKTACMGVISTTGAFVMDQYTTTMISNSFSRCLTVFLKWY